MGAFAELFEDFEDELEEEEDEDGAVDRLYGAGFEPAACVADAAPA